MPFMGVSILFGIWGLQISSRMFSPLFLEYKIMVNDYRQLKSLTNLRNFLLQQKYFAVQLVLLICKLQPLVAQIELAINGSNNDAFPMTKRVFSNGMWTVQFLKFSNEKWSRSSKFVLFRFPVIVQLLILIEVIALSFWSHHLYKVPFKTDDNQKDKSSNSGST